MAKEVAGSAEWKGARFTDVDLSGAVFRDVNLAGARVVDALLLDADISGMIHGLRVNGVPAFSVQHHPEAGPGPHDAAYLFTEFTTLMDES